MKLSSETIKILQNFSQINENLVVAPGSELRTISQSKTILAEVVVEEDFPEFSIPDLRKFLSVYSYFGSPDIEFSENKLTITDGAKRVVLYYANPSLLVYPQKKINLTTQDITFQLDGESLAHLNKISSLLSCDDLVITNTNAPEGKLLITVTDLENPTSDVSMLEVEGSSDFSTFTAVMKMTGLKFLPDSYDAVISVMGENKGVALFMAKSRNLKYYVALGVNSEFHR